MKIYIPSLKDDSHIGGGFTFRRNFIKGCEGKAEIVNSVEECDVYLISGVTMIDKNEVKKAKELNKKIVLRSDNVPRKSRNRRQSPHERLKEFAGMSDLVIYQSYWAKAYCDILCGDGPVIYNGVDTDIFHYDDKPEEREDRYLFAYHGKNEQKSFWKAHILFQKYYKENKNAEFWFIYDFGGELAELKNADYDFWNGEKFIHLPLVEKPNDMADIMRQCKYLIYPAYADASPNLVSEAIACGLLIAGTDEESGTIEVIRKHQDIVYTIQDMCDDYIKEFNKLK